jgi:MATE family multidrug resistance protein
MLTREYRINIRLAAPVILSQVGHVFVGVADSVMIGQFGAEPLGAASLANSIFNVLMIFGVGITVAITPLVAKAHSERNIERVAQFLKHGVISALVVSIPLLIAVLQTDRFLFDIGQPTDIVRMAIPYLAILTWSFIPLMLFQAFRQFTEGYSMTLPPMVISISANLINIFLNYILIYGKWGLPELGLNGAGYATLISRIIMFIAMAAFVWKTPAFMKVREKVKETAFEWDYIRRIFKVGVPTGLQSLFEFGAFSAAVFMMGWIGKNTLAAHQIAINLSSITFMFCSGIATAASIRVGNQYGLKNKPLLRTAAFTNMKMGAFVMGVFALVFILFGRFLSSLYVEETEVIQIAAQLLMVSAAFQLSDGLQVISLGALRGLEDVKIPAFITFVAYWIIGLPVGYYLAFTLDLKGTGIWIGLAIGLTAAASLLIWRFNSLSQRILPD